ncbi:hypothetical protein BDM02DRAFT_3273563 [Thelephora ganbajun]|uniref:Uncharacterized protein n=1 Tax=Thelephora ganbajun TaxID=370292 RepID=A0ACB6YY40_THEGA|nr:hypothetical protein BDM02DRAFT_3273563 [Thelephora ganbajun]
MSRGRRPVENAFAVVYGYLLLGISLAVYMNILTAGMVKAAGKTSRTAVRQRLFVVKVSTFIIIELITFPLRCSGILGLCTMWLLPKVGLKA